MWDLIVRALKEALKEKVYDMTKGEVKEWLDKLGVKVEDKVEAQKALLDTKTRRECRVFWGCVTGVMTLVGGVTGFYIAHLIG